jgi:hypothetical protein
VSLLQVLKDKSRFELSHKGTVTLENQLQAERLQVSPVGDDILSKMTITLDFGARDHLVRRVELKADGDANPHVLFMDDHRPVAIHGSPGSHMMVAFRLTAHRNKKRLGFETVTEVTFNQPRADSFFDEKPTRDKTRRVKPCIGGRIAFVEIPTDESDRVDQRAQDLKVWVEENELQTAGPLVFVRELSADQPNEKRVTRVFIPIASGADPEKQHKLFSIEQAETATAICKTLVADGDFSETIASLRGDADNRGKTPMALAYEIHFTPDGSTRQIQLLLKED